MSRRDPNTLGQTPEPRYLVHSLLLQLFFTPSPSFVGWTQGIHFTPCLWLPKYLVPHRTPGGFWIPFVLKNDDICDTGNDSKRALYLKSARDGIEFSRRQMLKV